MQNLLQRSLLRTNAVSGLLARQASKPAATFPSSARFLSTSSTNSATFTAAVNLSKLNNINYLQDNQPQSVNSSRSQAQFTRNYHSHHHHSHRMCRSNNGFATNVPGREVLPKNVTPLKYDLTLDPNFETFKFKGDVKIELKVNEDTNTITVNTLEIDIHSAKVAEQSSTDIEFDQEKQTATFYFKDTFAKDSTITLEINFTGTLNDNMAGFYRSSYQHEGQTKYLATTQMEPTDCRRAFPSFDEPALKAVFDITLISDKNLTALSNMDVKEVKELENDRKATIFNSTPLMSTYLVAFIVGDLRYVENNDFRIPIRTYATPGLEKEGQYAADLTAKTLAFLEEKFDIQYPLPKIDNVAIADFSAGAMENWGLITYRVVDLLFDEANSNLATKQRVTEVVQHELSHQWFGNLVTMDWWEGLWLNEGFATWTSWYACNAFYPDWKVWEQYVTDSLQQALSLDALRASHPIEVPVKRADEINQIFDAISYAKGSSLLKMISRWLGEDVFVKGVSNYLKKHQYGNTKTSDLWESLSEASGKNVVEVMDVWTKKIGFPVITVTEDAANNKIHVKQNRYLTTGDVKPEEDQTIYPVFLGLKTKEGVDESLVLKTREATIDVKDLEFFKINADQAGIYRTSYSEERWAKLGEAGVSGLLSVEDRAGLVADAGALAVSGYQSTLSLLGLVHGWKKESEFVVWDEILTRVSNIKGAWIFEDQKTLDSLNAFIRSLVSEKTHTLGWEFKAEDSFLEQRLKSVLFSSAASANDEIINKFALEAFAKYTAGEKSAIHPNLRAAIFNAVARRGTAADYEAIFKIYNNPVSNDEKITALRSLGRFENADLIQRTLGYLFDGTVRSQDIYIPLQGLRGHKAGIDATWAWAQANWDEITKRLPPGLSMLGSVVSISTSGYTSFEKAEEIEKFFAAKSTKGFDQGLAQSLDTIKSKAAWVKRDNQKVVDWLNSKNLDGPINDIQDGTWSIDFGQSDFFLSGFNTVLIDLQSSLQNQQFDSFKFDTLFGEPGDERLTLNKQLAKDMPVSSTMQSLVQRLFTNADDSHTMVDSSRAQAGLNDGKSLTFRAQSLQRNNQIIKDNLTVPVRGVIKPKHLQRPDDSSPASGECPFGIDEDDGVPMVWVYSRRIGQGHSQPDGASWITGTRSKPFCAIKDEGSPIIDLLTGKRNVQSV
ncbi:hypothetical protein WICPIJ_008223 [Wickerhamomyces pijperi]|uniref:Aminopeptidase n=1 Tax=Wickerhamomyces pijperi TaxID=599730 RepID=A0A9P8PYD9_WICPI|nr:hypothetical protein WICPIJ_008223 [Wickerhamomyces pijperi]